MQFSSSCSSDDEEDGRARPALFFLSLRQMGVPSVPRFRLDMGKPGACARIGNADQMLAGRALNLPAREMSFALQRLIAVGTVELEFRCGHRLCLHKRRNRGKRISKISPYFLRTDRA